MAVGKWFADVQYLLASEDASLALHLGAGRGRILEGSIMEV